MKFNYFIFSNQFPPNSKGCRKSKEINKVRCNRQFFQEWFNNNRCSFLDNFFPRCSGARLTTGVGGEFKFLSVLRWSNTFYATFLPKSQVCAFVETLLSLLLFFLFIHLLCGKFLHGFSLSLSLLWSNTEPLVPAHDSCKGAHPFCLRAEIHQKVFSYN